MSRAGCELSGAILTQIAVANESFEQAARRLIRLADLAYGQRDYEALAAISEALSSVPFAPAQRASRYFQALCLRRLKQYDAAAELLADLSAPRAIQTLATLYEVRGELGRAAQLYAQAAQSSDGFAVAGSIIQLATISSMMGDHQAALSRLRAVAPFVRQVARLHPHLWFQFHNEIAVELAAVGETEAATRAIAVAVASPIIEAYPEWHQTAAEIAEAEPSRLVVAVVVPQEQQSDAEAAPIKWSLWPLEHRPRRRRPLHNQPATRAPLNPRASPRAPPSSFIGSIQQS